MIPYAVKAGCVQPHHLEALVAVRKLVVSFPDGLTCHEVCARIADAMPHLLHVRGTFNFYDHSWLELDGCILDPYPWASASGPLLVVRTPVWTLLYKERV